MKPDPARELEAAAKLLVKSRKAVENLDDRLAWAVRALNQIAGQRPRTFSAYDAARMAHVAEAALAKIQEIGR